MHRALSWLSVSLVVTLLAVPAMSQAVDGGGIDTVFAIRKNTNRNRVDYGIRLDDQCRPRGDEPIVAYFRRIESGPGLTRALSFLERTVYGTRGERIVRGDSGGSVDFRVRALSDRGLRIESSRGPNGCEARAIARVNGTRAELTDIFVVLTGPRSVDHVEVTGRTLDGGRTVRESITD